MESDGYKKIVIVFLLWRWMRYVPPKRRLKQDLHSATSLKGTIFNIRLFSEKLSSFRVLYFSRRPFFVTYIIRLSSNAKMYNFYTSVCYFLTYLRAPLVCIFSLDFFSSKCSLLWTTICNIMEYICRAIAQAVSRWLPTAAARVHTRVYSCGICGGESVAGAGVLRVLRFPLPIFIPTISPQSPSPIIRGWYNRPVVAAVPRDAVSPH
jgi:hypothetical protein